MDRLIAAVAGLLVLIVILPTIAAVSQSTVPMLIGVLVSLVLIREVMPDRRR